MLCWLFRGFNVCGTRLIRDRYTANNGQEAVDFIRKLPSEKRSGSDVHGVEICLMVASRVQLPCGIRR